MFPTHSTQRARETQKEKCASCRHETQHKSPTTKRSKAEQKTQFRFRQNAVNRHVSGLASLRKHHSDRLEGHLTLFHVPSEWLQLTCIDFLCAIYSTHEMFCQEACVFFIKPFDFRQSLLTKQIFGCRMGKILLVSVPVSLRASGKNSEPGGNPGRYRRCMCRVVMLRMKVSHWETGKAA